MPLTTLVRKLTNSTSIESDEATVRDDATYIASKLPTCSSSSKIADYIVRYMFCAMINSDIVMDNIHAIKLAQSGRNTYEKRIGLLGASFLSPTDDMTLMLVNTLRKNLDGSSVPDITMVLDTVMRLMNAHFIPAIKGPIMNLVAHPSPVVRAKALLSMGIMREVDPTSVSENDLSKRILTALNDADVRVQSTAVYLIDRSHLSVDLFIESLEKLQRTLLQNTDNSIGYHEVNAPWLQSRILKLIPMSLDLFKESFLSVRDAYDGAFIVVLQTLRNETFIHVHNQEIDILVHRYLYSTNHNLQYLGLCCLEAMKKWDDMVDDLAKSLDTALQSKALDVMAAVAQDKLKATIARESASAVKLFECLWRLKGEMDFASSKVLDLIKLGPPKDIRKQVIQLALQYESQIAAQIQVSPCILDNESGYDLILEILKNLSIDTLRVYGAGILIAIEANLTPENADLAVLTMLEIASRLPAVDMGLIETVEKRAAMTDGVIAKRCRQFVRVVKDPEMLQRVVSIDASYALDAFWHNEVNKSKSIPIDTLSLRYVTRQSHATRISENITSTDLFATRWTSLRSSIKGSIFTSDDIEAYICSKGFSLVERIGDEILISGIANGPIYAHVRHLHGEWIYTVKCVDERDKDLVRMTM